MDREKSETWTIQNQPFICQREMIVSTEMLTLVEFFLKTPDDLTFKVNFLKRPRLDQLQLGHLSESV